ncbi:hypothetical protein JCM5353_006805 [Sporobolomyces roseus]
MTSSASSQISRHSNSPAKQRDAPHPSFKLSTPPILSNLSPLLTSLDLEIPLQWTTTPITPRFPLFSQLSTLRFSGSSNYTEMCEKVLAQSPNLVAFHVNGKNGGGFVSSILSKISSPTRIETLAMTTGQNPWYRVQHGRSITDVRVSSFTNLKQLTLGGGSSSGSDTFLNVLRGLPVEGLCLEVGETFALPSLITLVSPPNQHPTLRRLVLNLLEGEGEIGTRVAGVDFERSFSRVDPDTEDVEDDAMTDDWTLP